MISFQMYEEFAHEFITSLLAHGGSFSVSKSHGWTYICVADDAPAPPPNWYRSCSTLPLLVEKGPQEFYFRVYFEQVNQERYTVAAKNQNEAIAKAKKFWVRDFGVPTVMSVEQSPNRPSRVDVG